MTPLQFNFFSLLSRTFFRCSIFIAVILASSTLLFAQNIENLHLEKVQEEGLFNDLVVCINQDTNGFIWIGTAGGLYRYDGYNYKAFRNIPGDSTTLTNNVIQCLYPEKNYLWIGTSGGISRIDINTQKVTNFLNTGPLHISAILPKNGSVFWVSTFSGLFQFNERNLQLKKVPALSQNPLTSITSDRKGRLYLTGINGFYEYTIATGQTRFYHPELAAFPKADKSNPTAFIKSIVDHEGNLWMGTWDAGLLKFNTKTGQIKAWSHQTDDIHFVPYKIVADMLEDDSGNIWIANKEGGLTIYNPLEDKFYNYPVDWKSDTKLSGSAVCLFRDRSGTVWIGTDNGIYKYDPHRVYLSRRDMALQTDTGIIPAHISPISMLKDDDNVWWMGMYEGLFTFDPKRNLLIDISDKFGIPKSYPVFNIIQQNSSTIWITAKNTLVKISKSFSNKKVAYKTETFTSPDIQSAMYALYIDKENRVWIGTHSNGIYRFDPELKQFISYHFNVLNASSRIREVRTFYELSKDSMLVGGYKTGLYLLYTDNDKYKKITWEGADKVSDKLTVNSIYKSGGNIFLGTEYDGLWQTDTRFKKPVIKTINDGLPSMEVSYVTGDIKNNLWLLTNAGVAELEYPERKLIIYDKRDGLQNLGALNTIYFDRNSNILMAGRGVIFSFNPAGIIKNSTPPNVSITDMRLVDKDYAIKKGDTIKLNYDHSNFTFEYVALNYTQSRLNKYAYKMAGLEKKWNYVGPRRYVSYANLDEGTYTFYVKACNNEEVWNTKPASVVLIISPPFWRRWWFYLLVTIIVLSIIYLVYWYNLKQFKIRLQLRNKIARDLHDDIGSTLSGINIFSKIALQNLNADKHGSVALLEKISDRSEKTMDALSDIVWSISTKNDRIDDFLVKAREYLAEMLEPQGIQYTLNVAIDINHLKLGMELRKEFYLIFKEAICNAAKYAQCSRLEIDLSKERDIFTMAIRDNGKGFDISKITLGNGLQNMQLRAQKMKAKLEILSKPNEGTAIILCFHIPRFR